MDKKEILKFPNRVKFWQYIHSLDNKLDFANTLKLGKQWFYYDGEKYATNSFKQTLGELNTLINGRFNTEHSIVVGSRYTVFLDPLDFSPKKEVVQEEEAVVETVLEDSTDELFSLDFNDSQEDDEIDWGWVESLKNTKEDKKRLDEYADKFNVSLKRNMTIKNMVKDFKDQIK